MPHPRDSYRRVLHLCHTITLQRLAIAPQGQAFDGFRDLLLNVLPGFGAVIVSSPPAFPFPTVDAAVGKFFAVVEAVVEA